MANLLPDEIKKNIWRELFVRKLVVVNLALGLLLTLTIIILTSFYFSLIIREEGMAKISSAIKEELKEANQPEESVSLLTKASAQAKVVNSYWQEPLTSTVLAKGLLLQPKGIKILGIVASRGEIGRPIKMSFLGTSGHRNDLVNYVNLLRQDKFFSRVDLPVESLINDTGGQFVINLEK